MKNRLVGAVAAVIIIGMASSAWAEIVRVTWTGTINFGSDETGVFGTANADLTGNPFTAEFIFDTSVGSILSSPTQNYANGGTSPGIPSPLLSAIATINGISVVIDGSGFAQILGYDDGSISQVYDHADSFIDDGITISLQYFDIVMSGASGNYPASITQPIAVSLVPGDFSRMTLIYNIFNYETGSYSANVSAFGTPTSMTIHVILSPTAKDQCKKGGWKNYEGPHGPFKNQGDCIQFVNTGK